VIDPSDQALLEEARRARERAYAPYSRFRVGAALRGRSGKVYRGCNVENASFGLTVCAERVALHTAICEGERAFEAIAIDAGTATPTPPCGACRQVLCEFGELRVLLAGETRALTLAELLPRSFGPKDLLAAGDEEQDTTP
jgi:cytidine deaminase